MATTTTPTDPVIAAYEALISELGKAALAGDFDRGASFRNAALAQRDRWLAGQASAVRTTSKKAAA